MIWSLRVQYFSDVQKDTPHGDLPVVFAGTSQQCKGYAESRGYVWKDSRKHLLGGYWYKKPDNTQTGACLLPEVH